MIHLFPTFHGLESKNHYIHVMEFEEVVATFHNQNNTMSFVKLKFLIFALKEKTKNWLYSLGSGYIKTWAKMVKCFLTNTSYTIRPTL